MTAESAAAAAGATVHGYPRQGPNREPENAIEGCWKSHVIVSGPAEGSRDRHPLRGAGTGTDAVSAELAANCADLASRAGLRAGRTDTDAYEERIKSEIRDVLAFQEKAGIDVLVHGEPERNGMVQYFAEHLTGYPATQHGWVQFCGTRYVRPPILAGGPPVPSPAPSPAPEPMTAHWAPYAQALTARIRAELPDSTS